MTLIWQAELQSFDVSPPDGTLVLAVRRNPNEPFALAYFADAEFTDHCDGVALTDVGGWYALPKITWRDLPSYPLQLSDNS